MELITIEEALERHFREGFEVPLPEYAVLPLIPSAMEAIKACKERDIFKFIELPECAGRTGGDIEGVGRNVIPAYSFIEFFKLEHFIGDMDFSKEMENAPTWARV